MSLAFSRNGKVSKGKVVYSPNMKVLEKESNIFSHYNVQANFLISWKWLFENFKRLNNAFSGLNIMWDSFNEPPWIWLSPSWLNQLIKYFFELLCVSYCDESNENLNMIWICLIPSTYDSFVLNFINWVLLKASWIASILAIDRLGSIFQFSKKNYFLHGKPLKM